MNINKNKVNYIKKLVSIGLVSSFLVYSPILSANRVFADDSNRIPINNPTDSSVVTGSKGQQQDAIGGSDVTVTKPSSGSDSSSSSSPASTDWKGWKQYQGDWADRVYISSSGNYKYGDHVGAANQKGNGTVAEWGCYLVSMSIQIARSGVKTNFTPWDFIDFMHNNGFMNKSDDSEVQDEHGVEKFTGGKFRVHNPFKVEVGGKSQADVTTAIKTALDAGLYPIARINYGKNGYHFVAIDSVSGTTVTTFDPGSSSTDLFKQYGDKVDEIRVFESDTPSNKADGQPASQQSQQKVDLATSTWDEGKIPGMPKPQNWQEDPIPTVKYSDLNPDEKDSIEKWKAEVAQQNSTDVVTIDRVITMILGIAMMLFSMIYLVAFVFDRITITEFRAMEFLTKDRLTVSATGESTFLRGGANFPKLINTRDLIIIEFLMVGVSVVILNGGIFAIISWIVDSFSYLQGLIGW